MKDESLARHVALELDRRQRTFENIHFLLEQKQRAYLRDLIVRVLEENSLALPSSEWLEHAVDYYLPYLRGEQEEMP